MTITLTREEAQQVLDALQCATPPTFSAKIVEDWQSAVEFLRARLSAPEPKPVAWTVSGLITDFSRDFSAYQTKTYTRPLYTAPTKPEPSVEPVAFQCCEHGDNEWFITPAEAYGLNPNRYKYRQLYTAPPQREWQGLTEQEHANIAVEAGCASSDWVFYGAAVERALKEKNS